MAVNKFAKKNSKFKNNNKSFFIKLKKIFNLPDKDYNSTNLNNDLTNRNEHHTQMHQAMNNVASLLLNADLNNFDSCLHESLKIMGNVTEVDRVYVWKNHLINDELYCTQVYEWSENAIPQQGEEITKDISYKDTVPGWEEALSNNQCINNIIRFMTKEEQKQLAPQDILSILIVPVFLKDKFWGFVGFDDCQKERFFSEEEEVILRLGSQLIANALLHREKSQRLEEALTKANDASKAKSNFLATMSHEIRTPLNAIIGMTAIGNKAETIERKDYSLQKIDEASKHLLCVINNILDMSKIEADMLELSPTNFTFRTTIHNILTVVEDSINKKKQILSVNIDQNIPSILNGDDHRLTQVITNLLGNAVKFTPEKGNINLEAKLIEEENDICHILISVTDSGIGITEEQQQKLFNPFEQAEAETTRKYGGTGLGLAISKRIIEKMGGEIWIESEPNQGAKFNFNLYLPKGTVIENNHCNNNSKENEFDFTNHTILLAEDVEVNQEIIYALLEDTHINIESAENGKEAFEMFALEPDKFDLILMDIQMPIMDGYHATKAIRNLNIEAAKKIPIIAMTADVFTEDIDKCLNAGMNDHLGKPIDINCTLNILKKYLKRKKTTNKNIIKALECPKNN